MDHQQAAYGPLNLSLLALTYFFYFAQLGVLVPYMGVFLDGRGLSSVEIGQLLALITLTRVLGPNLWASMADKSGKGLGILQLGSLLTVACFSVVFFVNGFWGLTLSFALMMMFWTAVLPQLEGLCLNCVKGQARGYSRIRLWGSVGYIVLTIVVGKLIDSYSTEAPIYVSLLVLTGIFLSSLALKQANIANTEEQVIGSIWIKVRSWVFVGFIVSGILLQLSFGPYYSFFTLYTRDLGFNGQQTGLLIALGVAAEVVIFLLAGRIIRFFGVKWILLISTALTALRWYILALAAHSTAMLIFSQVLHAFGFAMVHAASMQFVHHYFGQRFQSRGQALYGSIAFGVGGAGGNYIAGLLWQQGEGAELTFILASAAASLSALLILFIPSNKMKGRASC
jgi:MFS transporter, PPP family, 3-phenylpropionic acid transporter